MTNPGAVSRAAERSPGRLSDLAFLLRQTRFPFWAFAAALLFSLVEIGGTLAFPMLTRDLVDRSATSTIGGLALLSDGSVQLLCLVLVAAAMAAGATRYLLATVGLSIVAQLKNRLIQGLLRSPVSWLESSSSGAHTSRIMQDSRTLAQLVSREALNASSGLLLLTGTGVILFTLDAALAATLFGVIGLAFLVALPIVAALSGIAFRLQEVTASLSGRLTQLFSEVRLVKASGAEGIEQERARVDVDALNRLGRRTARIESLLQPIISLAVTGSMVSILAYGGMRVSEGTLSAGTLTAFLLYVVAVIAPLAQLSSFFSQLSAARGASARMTEILRAPREAGAEGAGRGVPIRDCVAVPAGPQALSIEGLRFRYPGTQIQTLAIDELVLEAGSRTALIGASGCGKSTLLALIERFYVPESGAIRYGGVDIGQFPLAGWRSRIGYVPQSAAMLDGTIRDNILYGLQRPTGPAEIERALQLSRCSEFLAQLPEGLDSRVGERGVLLSGGQRQRVALARLFLRDPALLLLDEATSQLDEENEYLIVAGLCELMKGRTTIFVTHRMSLIEHMDRVVLLDDGCIVGAGDHLGLLEGSVVYRRAAERLFKREAAQ